VPIEVVLGPQVVVGSGGTDDPSGGVAAGQAVNPQLLGPGEAIGGTEPLEVVVLE
jgi:hypothetical protein